MKLPRAVLRPPGPKTPEFRNAVSAQRMGPVVFGIRTSGCAVEDVVGGEVNQPGVQLAASHRHVADRETIRKIGRHRLVLGDVHLIVGGGIDYNRRIFPRQRALYARGIRDIHV